jgi:hypothetical protein
VRARSRVAALAAPSLVAPGGRLPQVAPQGRLHEALRRRRAAVRPPQVRQRGALNRLLDSCRLVPDLEDCVQLKGIVGLAVGQCTS